MRIDDADMTIEEVEPSKPNDQQLILPVCEFLEHFVPPQCGRIVEGYPQDFDAYEAFEIPRGCSLTFCRKVNPNVPLSFQDSWGGAVAEHWLKITLPVEYQGKFELLPYDPMSGDTRADHIYHTVEELVKAFPPYVQANASYGDKILDAKSAFSCGDRLKLLRLVIKDAVKYLECRLLSEPQILRLPMECAGDFTTLTTNNSYLISDLISMVPRRRRVKLAADSPKHLSKLPGLPDNYAGELFIEKPDAFIEASPVDDSGLIIGLPSDLDLMIYPDETSQGQLFSSFVNANRNLFPVMARVLDWGQETSILENHRMKPGVQIVIHGWTKQSKVLAICGDNYYTIPLTYTGTFRIKPRRYNGVSELVRAYPGNKLRVVRVDPDDHDFPLAQGDMIRIKREDTLKRRTFSEVEIKCEKYESSGRSREIKLPLGSPAIFEELIEESRNEQFKMKELVSFVSDQELVVEVTKRSCDQKIRDDYFSVGSSIVLCDFIIEPAVYVSVDAADAPAFHIPLRTLIYVLFMYQLDKSASPLLTKSNPRLSTLDRCAELISSAVFSSLRPQRAIDTVDSFGRVTTQASSQSWVTEVSSTTNAWPCGLSASRDFDLLSGKPRKPPSVAESDIELTKSKGLSKLRSRFRRHKSQENIFRSNSPVSVSSDFAPLSVAKQDVEYTPSSINGNVILAERSVSVQNGQLHVTTQDPYSKASLISGSSVEINGEGSQSLSSASTPCSLTSSLKPATNRTDHTTPQNAQQTCNNATNNHPKQASTFLQNGINGANTMNGVNGMHTQSSVTSISSGNGSPSSISPLPEGK
ncbi:hypothetical protein LSH36_13g21002 [Paralvinella palmiformis]|uniref:CABIT domain-containing protein n=1 Tax=Paralvinella palmiformis TaxID=53620 RepID=A0AAD9NJ09_9ANNE|nr:hypothetical protein LSH36_13g21002 [Paralvinella palmiformis]